MACLAQQDGLARLREEIDGRGASEAKGALVDAQFQCLLPFGAVNDLAVEESGTALRPSKTSGATGGSAAPAALN